MLALFTAALSFSIRTGASGAIKAALFDQVPLHSGEMISAALGNSFLGFALSLLVISPLLDVIGAKRVILLASVCYIFGPILIILSPTMGGDRCRLHDADDWHDRCRYRLGRDRSLDQSGDHRAVSGWRGVPDLAAATRVWRDFFGSEEEVYTEGYDLIRKTWDAA